MSLLDSVIASAIAAILAFGLISSASRIADFATSFGNLYNPDFITSCVLEIADSGESSSFDFSSFAFF